MNVKYDMQELLISHATHGLFNKSLRHKKVIVKAILRRRVKVLKASNFLSMRGRE